MRKWPIPAGPRLAATLVTALAMTWSVGAAAQSPNAKAEFPKTDFEVHSVSFDEIMSGGPPRDGIPAIDEPEFKPVGEIDDLADNEPVISVALDGRWRAYPLRVLMWHEIVNDRIGETPVAVTYCPLCNSAVVFDRRVDGRELDFGTTGRLRNSDLVMYDRQTETWWQQFLGEGIIGELTGTRLKMLPVRVESYARFKERSTGDGAAVDVLVPNNPGIRAYGRNPYEGYDSMSSPFLYRGESPANIAPLAYVVAVEGEAWSLDFLRDSGRVERDDLVITWEQGQASALDSSVIADGRDIGNVVVQRRAADGTMADAVHDLTFAFAFHAFNPDGVIHQE